MDDSLVGLKRSLQQIVSLEENENPDWDQVAQISADWIDALNQSKCVNLIDEYIYHFLEDVDVRQFDASYGRAQRRRVKARIRD